MKPLSLTAPFTLTPRERELTRAYSPLNAIPLTQNDLRKRRMILMEIMRVSLWLEAKPKALSFFHKLLWILYLRSFYEAVRPKY